MNRHTLYILALCSLLSAGNMYYAQPLLNEIALSFGVTTSQVGWIPVLSQSGYVAGLIFLSPLADVLDNKSFLVKILIAESIVLLLFSLVQSFWVLEMMAFLLGFSSILVQITLPLVASLSAPSDRAKNLGVIISSALIGILLSRAISGWLGGLSHWRAVYAFASVALFSLSFVILRILPNQPARSNIKYKTLILSLAKIYRDIPKLRSIAFNGALIYAALSAFWATLAFYLNDHFHLGASSAGSFGFIGALGALSASQVGKFISKYGSTFVLRICMGLMLASFLIMDVGTATLIGLILGVIVLDIGAQAATVTNQNELYNLQGSAHARLNTIYKILYFTGGAIGSASSVAAWVRFGWTGVCSVGVFFICAALLHDYLLKLKANRSVTV